MKKYTDIFVKNDINSTPLFVGDKVRVTRNEIDYFEENSYSDGRGTYINIPEETWEGEIVLLLSKGIRIKTLDGFNGSNGYIKPNLTNNGYVKWTWEKL